MSLSNGSTIRNGSDGQPQPLWHIKDLELSATDGLSHNQTLGSLITEAENCLQQALKNLEYRKPDVAYRLYLRTYEILVNCVPRNPLYPDFKAKRGSSYNRFVSLDRDLTTWFNRFAKVKEIITNDNARNDTRPRLAQSSAPSAQAPQTNGHAPIRPPVSPKPDKLHGKLLAQTGLLSSPSSAAADPLTQRFERLKLSPTAIDTSATRNMRLSPQLSGSISAYSSPVFTSPTLQNDPRRSLDLSPFPTPRSSVASARPFGPRALNCASLMLGENNDAFSPSAPPMPQPPTPAYHPAGSVAESDLSRPFSRNMENEITSRNDSLAIAEDADSDPAAYLPRSSSTSHSIHGAPATHHRKSASMSAETRLSAEKLYDYLEMYNLLLIDVRSRSLFDRGHVSARSVICIEPTALRPNMSADALQDSLVLSPEVEQRMFNNRHKYDLVIYYDQSTSSDRFLQQPLDSSEHALRYLYKALHVFNDEKPLKSPPILLMGGIEAWTILVGTRALMTSNTAVDKSEPARIKRIPVPQGDNALQVTKKRLRDYNPLDAEEEQRWHERARQESVVVAPGDTSGDGDDDDKSDAAEVRDASPFNENAIEEFNRRFPDAASIGQQTHVAKGVYRPAPFPPLKIPLYPDAPQTSVSINARLPAIPTRPAPAAPRMSYSGVNERSLSTTSTRSTDLPAYVPPHLQPSNLRLPRTGLVNFGVTCYINATIQALSATLPLSTFFLDDKYEKLVQCDNWKGSKGVLPNLFANLIRTIWNGSNIQPIRPSTLRAFCARLNSEWGIDRQQDAKEFFDFLVDCLHEDLNTNWSRTPLRALTLEQEIERERRPKFYVSKEEWARYLHREQSYLTSLFGGQHSSRLRCTTCQFTSTTYEAFYSISVEIPRSGKSNIQDCLKSYCAEEMLSGNEVWKCPRCNREREATKKITLTRMPQFLVIHFKRFSASKGQSAKKVRTPIDFPLQNLNLEPYVLAPPSPKEAQEIARDYGANHLKTDLSSTPPYLYDAYAVMRHIGTTLTSGHYTCLARDRARKCWRQYNDTQTSDFDPDRLSTREKLQNEMAYIVFYQRMAR